MTKKVKPGDGLEGERKIKERPWSEDLEAIRHWRTPTPVPPPPTFLPSLVRSPEK